MVATLPSAFFVKPAGVEQIWWHWNYTAQAAGSGQHPLPTQPYDPHARLPGRGVHAVRFDPAAAQLRGRRWRAARTDTEVFVRTYRDADDEYPTPIRRSSRCTVSRHRHRLASSHHLQGARRPRPPGHRTGLDDPHDVQKRRRSGVGRTEHRANIGTSIASAAVTP